MKKEGFLIILIFIALSLSFLINIIPSKEEGIEKITTEGIIDAWATFSVSIQVKAVNITTTAPTTATEDILYSYDVNATGNNLVYNVNSSGLFTINTNTGLISFTPRNGQNGIHNINVSVYNAYGDIDSQSYTLVISAVNDAPVLEPIVSLSGETGTQHTYTITATDEENAALTYSIPTKDAGLSMTINSNTGLITIPSGNYAGDYSATIRVSDGTNTDEEDITVHIVSTNYAPTILTQANSISSDLIPIIREDQSITFDITYNDDNGDNTANVQWKLKNGSLSFNNVGTGNSYIFAGAPGSTAGTYQIKAVVSDGVNSVTSSIWTLKVNKVTDSDGDGIYDYTDNCKFIANADQEDADVDDIGDACEDDLDADGVADADDFIDGDVNKIVAKDHSGEDIALTLKIANNENINQIISGTKRVEFATTTVDTSTGQIIVEPIVEFDHSFASDKKLDLSNISLKKEIKVIDGTSAAVVVISGVSLATGETKTAYLDILKDESGVCIRDTETNNADELSTDCSGDDETQIGCDSTLQSGFTCTKNTTLNKYKITGLSFSGIGEEDCTESWSCTDWSTCSGGTQTRTCTDANHCGTENSKPDESQSCVSPGVPTGGAVSSGGGSTGGTKTGPSFFIDREFIKISIKKGNILTQPIKITNTGNTLLSFVIDLQELKQVLFVSEPLFTLNKGEEKTVNLNIITGKGVAPGVYVGDIIIKAGNPLLRLIKTIIEIESEKVLFDISLDIPSMYKNVNPGEELILYSTLLNMGGLTDVNISIEYAIKDSSGKEILKEDETVIVDSQTTFTKKFKLPKDLSYGEYIILAIVNYQDSVGTSSEVFTVGKKELLNLWNISLIIGVLMFLIIISIWQRKSLKSIERKQIKRLRGLEKSNMAPLVLKQKLEKELSLLDKNYKSKYISKGSYEKGKERINSIINKINKKSL